MRKYIIVVLFTLCTFFAYAQPRINSFSPASGPIGSSIIINGTGFGSSIAANTVYFGGVKATITSASSTSLTVTVPAGAVQQFITVTANNLTAYSLQPFTVSFPGGGTLHPTSFIDPGGAFNITTSSLPRGMVAADLDGDGKPDMAVAGFGNIPDSYVSLHRNTSVPGTMSFAAPVTLLIGDAGSSVVAADFDGDGKMDIAATYVDNNGNVSIFKNNSTPGSFNFAAPVTYASGGDPFKVVANDVDGDGKPDIVICNYLNSNLAILRNTSSGGVISFAPRVEFTTGLAPRFVALGDIDGDGRIDIATANQFGNSISVFRNTSSVGTIAMAARQDLAAPGVPYGVAIGDLDSDGKPDIAIGNHNEFTVSIYRNLSSSGNLAFATRVNYGINNLGNEACASIAITDLDGDAKPELVAPTSFSSVEVLKNNSTSGTPSFVTGLQYFGGHGSEVEACDIDGDGKTDLGMFNISSNHFTVLRNRVNEPYIYNFGPVDAIQGQTVTITGIRFTGVTAVSFGGVPATSFTVVNDGEISAVVGAGASGVVQVTNLYGKSERDGFKFHAPPTISSFTPDFSGTGGVITITGTYLDDVTAVSFGGTPAASFVINSATSITAVVANGSTGNVSVTSPYGSASLSGYTYYPPPTITSFTPTLGGIGTVITINGTNFTGTNAVTIGNVAVSSFTVVNATTITAVIAQGASGTVRITTPGGTAVSSNAFAFPPPTITSINPLTGAAGTTVTITGTNFVTNPSSNIVFFGAMQAVVTHATNTTLTVVVPAGTTYLPFITVAVNNHTAFAQQPFSLRFPDPGTGITANSFVWKTGLAVGEDPGYAIVSDVDGDGKNDLIVHNYFSGTVSALLNNSSTGFLSFAPATNVVTGLGNNATVNIEMADVTSDGKPDMIMGNWGGVISVYRNTSVAGTISFAPKVDFPGTYFGRGMAVQDFDGDAKPDIAVAQMDFNADNPVFAIYRNTGIDNNVSFAPRVFFALGSTVFDLQAPDLDGDGKPDIIASTPNGSSFDVFRNTSVPGTISFATKQNFPGTINTQPFSMGNIDADNKIDIVSVGSTGMSVLRNTSSIGAISFAPKVDFAVGATCFDVIVGQLDGDGSPDVLVTTDDKKVSVFRNITGSGAISFAPRVDFVSKLTFNATESSSIGDMDGDGKPDIIVASSSDNKISIFRNQLGEAATSVCANATASIQSDKTGTTYQWQVNTGTGFTNISNGVNYSGVATATLQIVNVPVNWNGYQYRCVTNTGNSGITNLIVNAAVKPTGTVTTPPVICANQLFNIVFAPSSIPVGSTLELWESVNGGAYTLALTTTSAGNTISLPFTITTVSTRRYFFRMIPPAATVCPIANNTDTATLVIDAPAVPVITAAGNVLTVTNPEAGTTYTWQINQVSSWNNVVPTAIGTSYTIAVMARYRVSAVKGQCLSYSNELSVIPTAVTGIPGERVGLRLYPNPVQSHFIIDTLKLADRWETLDMINSDGRYVLQGYGIKNSRMVTLSIEHLPGGVYSVILRRKQGRAAVLLFVKQ